MFMGVGMTLDEQIAWVREQRKYYQHCKEWTEILPEIEVSLRRLQFAMEFLDRFLCEGDLLSGRLNRISAAPIKIEHIDAVSPETAG